MPKDGDTEIEADVDREEAAFMRLHSWLWENCPHEFVAIHGCELIDHDTNQVALFLRMKKRFPTQFVWIAPVREKPIEEYFLH